MARRVLVTGTGLVSCRGEGLEVHRAALREGSPPPLATEPRTGLPIHPAPPLDWDRQIPKRSEQRQMEAWQRLGVYGAGLALEAAGLHQDAALKVRMQMIVSAGGGERDYEADSQILAAAAGADEPERVINGRLASDLRPTLFLAQLSNMLAGNIAIVHGVTGASRTFMGEEASGLDALRVAEARIAAGQADLMLVGGSFNAERPDLLVIAEIGGHYGCEPWRPIAERGPEGGFLFGSGAGFLVLEAEDHAASRGAVPLAVLEPVASTRTGRAPGEIGRALAGLLSGELDLVLSGANGLWGPTREEREALATLVPGREPVWLGDLWGQLMEAAAPAAAALAAGMIAAGDARTIAATVIGYARGEGLLRLGPAG